MNRDDLLKYGGLATAGLLIFSHIRKNPNKLGGLLPSEDSRNQAVDQFFKRNGVPPVMSEMTKNVLNDMLRAKMGYDAGSGDVIDVTPRNVKKK